MSTFQKFHESAQATVKDFKTNDVVTVIAGAVGAATSGINLKDPLAIAIQSIVVIATVTYVVFRAIKMFYEMQEVRHRVRHLDDPKHPYDELRPPSQDG